MEPANAIADNEGIFHWLGSVSHVQALYVWVPAHWATCSICAVVKEKIEGIGFFMKGLDPQHGACEIPTLVVSLRAPWLELPVAYSI